MAVSWSSQDASLTVWGHDRGMPCLFGGARGVRGDVSCNVDVTRVVCNAQPANYSIL